MEQSQSPKSKALAAASPRSKVETALLAGLLVVACWFGCRRQAREPAIGEAYMASETAYLRDRLGATQVTVATVRAGERLEILRRRRRWLLVRTSSGTQGWLEERHTVPREVYDRFQGLVKEAAPKLSQGEARARQHVNLHLEPSRKAPRFFQLREGETCDTLERRVAERPLPQATPGTETVTAPSPSVEKKYEDWYLVRAKDRAGWGLARYLDMTVPDEILQYAERKRVVAWFVLDKVQDKKEGEKPQVLWATADREGLPYDFDSFRVFTWNDRRRRYETAYIERDLKGYFPIRTAREKTEQGEFPTFTVTTENKQGQKVTRKFILRGNFVRRLAVL